VRCRDRVTMFCPGFRPLFVGSGGCRKDAIWLCFLASVQCPGTLFRGLYSLLVYGCQVARLGRLYFLVVAWMPVFMLQGFCVPVPCFLCDGGGSVCVLIPGAAAVSRLLLAFSANVSLALDREVR